MSSQIDLVNDDLQEKLKGIDDLMVKIETAEHLDEEFTLKNVFEHRKLSDVID